MPRAIAHALGLADMGGHPLLPRLQAALREREVLLLLDNFEQVVAAAPVVAELLAAAPQLKVLLTSRVVVGIYGEYASRFRPWHCPTWPTCRTLTACWQVDTVRLFVERARAARLDFRLTPDNAATVSAICQQLDGLPLAIELAAARVRLLPPQLLLQRLTARAPGERPGRLTLLSGGPRSVPARQQSLRDTLSWSYDLLEPPAQRLFWRLAVFVGGCSLDAVTVLVSRMEDARAAVVVEAGLQALLDSSLVQQRAGVDGEARFVMLETVREYALERLEASGEWATLQQHHAAYFLALAEAKPAASGPQQRWWWDRLEHEHANLRAALAWSRTEANGETAFA